METESNIEKKLYDRISELQQELDKFKEDNYKLICHQDMQDLTIEKLYMQLNNPQTSFTSNGYLQSDLPKTTLTYICWNCNEKDEELDKYKAKEKELREILEQYADLSCPANLSQCTFEITMEEINKMYSLVEKVEE